jgi:hypothetical protein
VRMLVTEKERNVEWRGIVLDSFAATHAMTHMRRCVRTGNVDAPHHKAVSPREA